MPQISIKAMMDNNAPSYSPEIVQPFRDELTAVGFKQLFTISDVDAALDKKDGKVILLVLNSVCGCSARTARPGAILSMLNRLVPDEYVTLFAGMEKEAVSHFRNNYLKGLTPSSPNISVFKDGELIHILHRHMIEGKNAESIAAELASVYDLVCSKKNPAGENERLRNFIREKYQAGSELFNA